MEGVEPNTCVSDSPDVVGSARPSSVKKTVTPVKRNHTTITGDKSTLDNNTHDKAIVDFIKGDIDDKYSLTLTTKSKFKSYKPALRECKTTQKWDCQNKIKFDFIPLGDLTLRTSRNEVYTDASPLQVHKLVKKSGKFNFLQSQIILKSQLKPERWEALLTDYWDQQLVYLIKHGFPLDFDHLSLLTDESKNHNSAVQYPEDIEAYLQEEMKFNAILGPFTNPPLPNLHHSPFVTKEKPGAPGSSSI